jgi:hypothetical protein
MFQFNTEYAAYIAARDLALSRELHPELSSYESWLERNVDRIPVD